MLVCTAMLIVKISEALDIAVKRRLRFHHIKIGSGKDEQFCTYFAI